MGLSLSWLVSKARRNRREVRPLNSGERASNWLASDRKKSRSSLARIGLLRISDEVPLSIRSELSEGGRKSVTASISSQAQESTFAGASSAICSKPLISALRRRASSDRPFRMLSMASSSRSMASRIASANWSLKTISPLRSRVRTVSTGCTTCTARSIRHRAASPLIL